MNFTHYGYIPKVVRSLTNDITHINLNDSTLSNYNYLINYQKIESYINTDIYTIP